ncbi:unnamed protein product [Aphanomyces euteiches]
MASTLLSQDNRPPLSSVSNESKNAEAQAPLQPHCPIFTPLRSNTMFRINFITCFLLALSSFVCVDARQMFTDSILAKIFKHIVQRDSQDLCKTDAMKHKLNQITTNCGLVATIVGGGATCALGPVPGVITTGVLTALATIRGQMETYMTVECGRFASAASGKAKMTNVITKNKVVNAFKTFKKSKRVLRRV